MDTEELEQYTEEGENRNTASLHGSIAGYQTGSAKTLFPVQKTDKVSVSFVSPRIVRPSHAAHYLRKERTPGSLSIDKIGDEKNE